MARRSKKEAEDLLQTHVLNLTEIRQAADKVIKIEHRRHALYISLIGIFLITLGICFPKIKELFVKETRRDVVEYATKIEKNTIICLSEFVDATGTYKIATKNTYTFDSIGLTSKEGMTAISMVNSNDTNSLTILDNYYKNLYSNSVGVINTVFVENNILYFRQNIANYKLVDMNTYNPEINIVNKTSTFVGGESMSEVKKKEIALGSSCS